MTKKPEVPYDEDDCRQEWIEAIGNWKWKAMTPDHRVATGQCPRCGHPIQASIHRGVVVIGPVSPSSMFHLPFLPKDDVAQATVRCNCRELHRGRPSGGDGCGLAVNIPVKISRT